MLFHPRKVIRGIGVVGVSLRNQTGAGTGGNCLICIEYSCFNNILVHLLSFSINCQQEILVPTTYVMIYFPAKYGVNQVIYCMTTKYQPTSVSITCLFSSLLFSKLPSSSLHLTHLTSPTMTKGFATITPECEEVFDEVKGTDNLNYVIYSASAHDKKITVAESGKYKDYAEFLSHFKDNAPLYAVVDFLYDSPAGDGQRSKLVFITWYV